MAIQSNNPQQQDYLSQLSSFPTEKLAEQVGGIVAGDEVFQRNERRESLQFPSFKKFKVGGSWFPMSQRALPEYELFGSGSHDFFQRYAQDGDAGFFHGMRGGAEPLGVSPFPPPSMTARRSEEDVVRPLDKPLASSFPKGKLAEQDESKIEPVIVEPSPLPNDENLVLMTKSEVAEPQQHSLHVPPFSSSVRTGFGKDSALYEEPFELPEYKGSLHKKKSRFSK